MFEKLVTSVINSYFGKYIQNLDSSNLDISLLGNAELTELQLRPEALAQLDLPIEVKAGFIGRMKIDIPWTNLFSADVHVYLEDVYILAGPVTDRQYDPQRERQLQNAVKRQKLEALEKSAVEEVVESTEEEPGLYEKLMTDFVKRLQLSIRNIHIRYEDTITNADHPFSCGIMLKQISIHSTDSRWNPLKGESSPSNFLHKLLRLENLAVYWNPYIPEQHLLKTRLNTDGWRNLLRMSIDSHNILQEEFDFIIEPVTAQARVIISTENNSLPKMFADFTLDEIEVLLSRQQFLNLLALKESFQMMRVNQRYRKYHPNVPLKVSPKSWWLYAYTAILEEVIRPYSWERIKEHRIKYKKYKDLYKKSLANPENESIHTSLWELEESLDVANILVAREHAKVEFLHEAPERAKRIKKKKKTGWFGSWFGSSASDEELEVEIEKPDKQNWLAGLSNEEKEKLYQGIGYDENANATAMSPEYVKHKVQIILKSCCLSLVNYSKKILQVSVTHMLATWEDRPATGAFRISSNTESFSIEGASIEHELIPILTSDIGVYAPSVNQVFTLDFEVKPLYVDADYSLSLSLQPVEIVYDEHSLSEVSAFFQVPHGGIDMRSAAMETLQGVASYSRAGLQYAIDKHKTVHVAINMRSPYVVVPEFGTLHRGGNVLVADFGTLRVDSELQPKDVSLEDATMSEIESRLYDQFNIKLSEVKVLLADSGDDWHTAQTQPDSEYHILPSVQLVIAFFNAVKMDYKQLPQQKLVASLPTLKLNISDKKMLLLMSFLRNFPIPASTSAMTLGEDMVDSIVMMPTVSLVEKGVLLPDLTECQLEPDIVRLRLIRRSILGRKVKTKTVSRLQFQTSKDVAAEEMYYSASDHSDEEVEEWSDYLKIKPVDDNMYPSNSVKILVRMTLGEFVINLTKVMDKHETPYLMFRVNRLRIDSSLTVFGYGVHATLGGIQLVDKIHTGSAGEYMEMLGTSSDTDLVSVLYRHVRPECPDFDKGYGSIEHAILLKFSHMSALFDQASLIYLNTFIQSMFSSVQNMDMKTSTSTVTSELIHKDRPSLTERLTSITDEVDNLPPRSIKMNLVAQLENFSVRLCDSENNFALIDVRGFQGHVLVKGTKTTVRCRLKDLSVQDCSVGAIYPKILMIEDDNCFDLKFVKFNKSSDIHTDNKQKSQALDYSIRLRVGQLQMVYLSKFYWELIRFFEPFINSEMTEAARVAAVETMTRQYDDIKTQNIRISLNVDLRAPTILIPQHSKSTEMFLLNLGDLAIKNYFHFSDVPPDMKQEWNHIYMNLSHVQMNRVSLCLADEVVTVLHNVIEPISFKADVQMALKPVVSDVKLDISGHLNKIKLNIVSKDLQLLLAILRENLTEGAPQHTSGIYESPTMQQIIPQISLDAATPISDTKHSLEDMGEKSSVSVLFRLEGVSATLFEQSCPEEGSIKGSLCHMEIEKLSLNIISHSDGDIKSNFALQSVTIDDSRPDSDLAVKRILYCSSKKSKKDDLPLMSLIYKISSDGNQKADLMLEKLRLNIHVPYLLVLWKFFQEVLSESGDLDRYSMISSTASAPAPERTTLPQTSINIYGTFKQPEIVLFADPTKIHSRVVVLYADVAFEYRTDPEKQYLWSKLSNLQLVSSINTGTNNSRSQVLSPCAVELTESYQQESGEMDVSVKLTKMNIYLSASIVQLLWDVYSSIQLPVSEPDVIKNDSVPKEVPNLWRVSTVTNSKYLMDRMDHTDYTSHLKQTNNYIERLKIDIEELNAMFAVENLDVHVPILCLRTSLEGRINDWSNKLHIEGEFHLEMFYFNEKLDVWEPLIEPVMVTEGVYRPWEVLIKVVRTKGFPMACNYSDGDLDIPDGLQNEVQNLMHKARIKSSSSETDSDTAEDMTIIRRRSLRKSRLSSTLGVDQIDGTISAVVDDDDDVGSCVYLIVDSQDQLLLNITPQAISVINDVIQALAAPADSDLCVAQNLPAFKVINELGVHATVTLHPDWKIRNDHIKNATILKAGENNQVVSSGSEDDIEIICEEESPEKDETPDSKGFVEKVLADAGHTLVNAGAFVFDDDEDYLSGNSMDIHRFRLQVDGFEPLASILHKKDCRKLLPLAPKKNCTRYCFVLDIDIWHGSKVIKMYSPLQLKNNLTLAVDVWCRTEDLKKYRAMESLAGMAEYSKLATVAQQEVYYLPLFVAFHCKLHIAPSDLSYDLTYNPLWWQDLVQAKEKSKYFMCQSQNEEKKSFNFKVLCKEGLPLNPVQTVPKTIPYHTISLHAPVTLHNYLPYDLQFSLEGTGSSSSLTHGESTPLYTINLQKTYKLLISINDYLGCDWRGSLDISSELDEFKAITMETDIDIENVNKYLSLSIHADHTQALDLYIYSPYWIVNKTELPLQIRGSVSDAVFECGAISNPVLFRFKKYKRKKTRLRVYESKWSKSFSLDTVASSGVVICHEKERQQKYMFMVQSQMSNLKLTKIITVLPFFLIINCSKQKLRFMEENEEADLWFDINLGECKPFWPTTESFNMYVKYEQSIVMSQHFPFRKPHTTVLRMQHGTAIVVEVKGGTDSPITVTFRDFSPGDAPVRVENLCEDVFIKIHQKNQSQVSLLSATQALLYTWDEPVAERTLMWNVYGRKKPSFPCFINKDGAGEVRLSVRSLRTNGPTDVTDSVDNPDSSPEDESDETDGLLKTVDEKLLGKMRTDKMVIFWVSYLDGLQRVLLFTQDERIAKSIRKMNEGEQTTLACFISLDGITMSCINSAYEEVALFSLTSSPTMWEVEVNGRWKILNAELAMWLEDQWKNEVIRANLHDQIEADLVKMQMSKPFMGALRRTYHPGLWFQYRHSEHHMAVFSKIQRLQLDNQLQDAYFPTVFCPAPIPSYILKKTGTKPFIEVGFMRRIVPENNIDTVRYCKVLIQEFTIRLDKGFILSTYDIFAHLQIQEEESSQLRSDLLIAQRTLQEVAAVMEAARPQKIYFEYFHFSPLKMHVSFSLNGTPHVVNQRPSSFASDVIDFFLNSVGATLTEIKDVELRMAYFQKKGEILSVNQLIAEIRGHYTQQALQQAYVLILGLDVLGNPYGLVKDFTQGLGDFFYEPFLGSIQGSDEFADSLTQGVQSLMGNTVGGAAGSIALVTGSIGNTLAVLSFDEEYKRKRRSRMQQQPKYLPSTIFVASRNLVMGVCLGFTGIVLDPLKGAHEDGVEGFFKGIGKGILGLLTKPTGGIVDMISMAFDGIRRAAETESGLIARMRLPRFINRAVGLKPYSHYRAAGLRLLQSIRKGEYSKTDLYWSHAPLTKDERADVMMITDRHLLVLEKCRIWGGWDVEWEANIDQILGVPAIVEDKLIFKLKRDESSLNLFSGTEQEIHSPEPELLLWIQKQVENVIRYREQ